MCPIGTISGALELTVQGFVIASRLTINYDILVQYLYSSCKS